ncbi:uncharacterized protein MELLADRAFT_107372 [Melampsora larici-populina 98AG31]|uniref:Uncharacterized protein n=1 Tax=Melampsora larici-populina (strain 98AG31 / pathotype 3-4-7) TaxID=747676 RepID=F4RPK4_MELLP|nr:uncharacterized protein MELLADRAFT_107372 [Melampsora larici-populina 98AG31]EGG05708.1 hypothetical protein MELLADRAFT_107372 [Melampsora larici-populina 98AG31]
MIYQVCFDGFLNRLRSLQEKVSLALVIVLHTDLIDFLNPTTKPNSIQANQTDQLLFYNLITYSHVILKTRNLGLQGTGELTVYRGQALLDDLKLPVTVSSDHVCQYRIQDNVVNYFTKGLDRGFL